MNIRDYFQKHVKKKKKQLSEVNRNILSSFLFALKAVFSLTMENKTIPAPAGPDQHGMEQFGSIEDGLARL